MRCRELMVSAVLATVLLACRETPTAPAIQVAKPASLATHTTDQADCVVLSAMTIDGFRKRAATVRMPTTSQGAAPVMVLLRRWAAPGDMPLTATLCTIPDSPEARAWFEAKFVKGDRSRGHNRAAEAGATSNLATTYDVTLDGEECDPEVAIVACGDPSDPYGDGWSDGPSEPEWDSGVAADVAAAEGSPSGDACYINANYPHKSNTPNPLTPWLRLIQGKAKLNNCTRAVTSTLVASLQRERCYFWFFCSWPTVNQSLPVTRTDFWNEAIAQSSCISGNYKTRANLTINEPDWYPNPSEWYSATVHITCYFWE